MLESHIYVAADRPSRSGSDAACIKPHHRGTGVTHENRRRDRSGSPLFGLHPNTPVAPNVIRLVVNGSSSRTEYVRLTFNPEARDGKIFTAIKVPLR